MLGAILLAAPVSAQDDMLSHYLKAAAENNPDVKAAFLTYEASLQKVPQMGAYEDPRLDMGFFLEPMELVSGRQIAQFQLMQMFPWFGTKKAAQTEAQHMAQMAFESFREIRDKLFLDVYTQWYLLCSLQQKQINSEENKKLLQQLETLAIRKFSTGRNSAQSTEQKTMESANKGQGGATNPMSGMNMGTSSTNSPSVDLGARSNSGMDMASSSPSGELGAVLRIQIEQAELESTIESLLSEILAAKVRFNVLLNRPVWAEILVPDTLIQLPFLPDEETIMQQIAEYNPMLGMIREEKRAYEAQLEMAKKMSYPMFGIGIQYMLIGKMPESNSGSTMETMKSGVDNSMKSMNGKDMLMPMVSVTIPIYRNKYKAAQRESKLLHRASEEKYVATVNSLQAEWYQYKHQLNDASLKIALYRKQAGLVRTTYDLLLQSFASGKSELGELLQVQRQLLDYRLKEAEAIAAYNTALATIQKLTAHEYNVE
jgi:outer membrane protein TolC